MRRGTMGHMRRVESRRRRWRRGRGNCVYDTVPNPIWQWQPLGERRHGKILCAIHEASMWPIFSTSAPQFRPAAPLGLCLSRLLAVVVCLNVCLYMVGRQLYKYVSSFSHLTAFASSSPLALPDSDENSTWTGFRNLIARVLSFNKAKREKNKKEMQ